MHHVYWYRGPINMARGGQGYEQISVGILAPGYLVYSEGNKVGL